MKRFFLLFLGVPLFFLIGINEVQASHIPGANITYTCNPSNPLEYTFTLTLFRRCPGTHPATMTSTYFTLTNTCGLTNPAVPTFNQVGTATDVNQLCATAQSNCTGGTQPGIYMYTYEATITLPANCDSWQLEYDLCCRDASSNVSGSSSQDMVVYTTLNTTTAPCNNSPVVTSAPIPYACTNTNFTYCLTIADQEADSVTFSMVTPVGAGQTPLTWLAGFSTAAPLNNFTLDPLTGCISFNHPNTGNYVVAIQITSYNSAGQVIAEIIHDFQVMVISCTNTPPNGPTGGISNFTGQGTQIGPYTISACYGDQFCFDVVFEDPVDVADVISITQDGTTLLPGATFNITGTNPVTGTFCWTAQPGFSGSIITFTGQDNGCPVMGTTAFAVDLDIATGVYAGPDITICGAQTAQLQGNGASSYTWSPATGLSCTNCPNPTASPSSTTTYYLTGNLSGTCPNQDTITVNVVPDFPLTLTPSSATICANEVVQLNASGPGTRGPFNYVWDPDATLNDGSISNPLASPMTSTTYVASVTSADGCTMSGSIPITVAGIGPTVSINPTDTNICAGAPVQLTSTAAVYPISCGISSGCSGPSSQATVGTGTSATSSYTPFRGSTSTTTNYTAKSQFIYTAAELNAMGYYGGTIRDLSLYFTTSYTYQYDAVEIWMGCTTLDEFSGASFIPTGSLTQVFGAQNNFNPPNNNWHTFNITDFDWDGTSNIVIQMCAQEDNTNDEGSESVRYTTTTPYIRCIYDYSTTATILSCNEPTGFTTTNRPNMRFTICEQQVSTPTYNWTPATALSNSGISNPIASPTTTTSYVLDVTDGASGCTGSAIVNFNVSPDYTLSTTASQTSICYGSTTNLSATPSAGTGYTYQWEPATALNDANISNPTATPTSTTTFMVTVTNGNCVKYDSVVVNVSGGPVSATASDDFICPNDPVTLDVAAIPTTCGLNFGGCTGTSNTGTVGSGTASSTFYTPFYGSYQDVRTQMLFTAAELNALGLTAGTITALTFNVITKSTTGPLNGFTVKMGCTSATALNNTAWEPTAGTVFGPVNYTSTLGANTLNLTTAFDWDGVSNIIVEVCHDNSVTIGGDACYYATPGYICMTRNYSNTVGPGCTMPPAYTYSYRPLVDFTVCQSNLPTGATYAWAPAGDLNDATLQSPTATPATTTNYTVSVTDPANPGCPSTGSVLVNVRDYVNTITPGGPINYCSGDPAIGLNAQLYDGGVAVPLGSSGPHSENASQTLPLCSTIDGGDHLLTFTGGTPNALGNVTLEICMIGDFGAATVEDFTVFGEGGVNLGLFNQTTAGTAYADCAATPFCNTITITQAQWNLWNSDGVVEITIDVSTSVNAFCTQTGGTSGNLSSCVTTASVSYMASTGTSYTWSPATGLSSTSVQSPTATPTADISYIVSSSYGGCIVTDTVDIVVGTPSTPPVLAAVGMQCPNTTMTLTAGGGTAGTGSTIEWYDGPGGTGTWLGAGGSYSLVPTDGQTIYVRREGACGATADDQVTINVRDYIYAANGTSTNTYCTDDLGWHHFYVGNDIIFSMQGDLSGAPAGFPMVTINDNGAYFQQAQGPFVATDCAFGLLPGEERFEMERSWNVDFGGGTLNPPYDVRFYYQPAERTAIETAAANWIATYPACQYVYKYPYPQGFYWFKNVGSNYVAPQYDGTHLMPGTNNTTATPNAVNYDELNGIASFSGGSAAVILVPTNPLLPVEWLYFTGETDGEINHLNWATETEVNSEHFNLQRSKDGINFETIATIAAAGNSTTEQHYSYDDVNPIQGVNYYRLELVDRDGEVQQSHVVPLLIQSSHDGYSFYPNPTSDKVYYQYVAGQEEDLEIEVIDALGRTVRQFTTKGSLGVNNIEIDLSDLPSAGYIIKVHNSSNAAVHTGKVVKKGF